MKIISVEKRGGNYEVVTKSWYGRRRVYFGSGTGWYEVGTLNTVIDYTFLRNAVHASSVRDEYLKHAPKDGQVRVSYTIESEAP